MSQPLRLLLNNQAAMQAAIREHMATAADTRAQHWIRKDARQSAEAAAGMLALILIRKAQATSKEDF